MGNSRSLGESVLLEALVMSRCDVVVLPRNENVDRRAAWLAALPASVIRQQMRDRCPSADWRPSDPGVRTQPMSVRRRSTQLCGERPGERDAPPHGRALLDCVEKVVPGTEEWLAKKGLTLMS